MKKVGVYILLFKSGKYYVGSTKDINARLKHHSSGGTISTRRLGNNDFKLVFFQETPTLKLARNAEKRIKSWKRKDYVDRIVSDSKISFLDEGN